MRERRGSQHLEIILALILFVGFGAAVIYYVNPFSLSPNNDTTLNYVFDKIIDNSSIYVERYTIILEDTSKIHGNSVTVNLGRPIEQKAISRVKTANESVLGSNITDYNSGELIFDWNLPDRVIYIELSEDFAGNPAQRKQQTTEEGAYNIASLHSKKIVSEKRIRSLADEYNLNYETLLKYFGLPEGRNFGFEITEEGIDAMRIIPSGINVFAKSERREMLLDMLGQPFSFKKISVKTW